MKIHPGRTIGELVAVLSYVTDTQNDKRVFHGWKVAIAALGICRGLSRKDAKNAFYAGLLHDIGGVGLPLHVIHYLSLNNKASQNILLSHPIIGAQLVSNIPGFGPAAKFILDHHEWINGNGYPRAKTKKDIPLGAQIIRVCDALDIVLNHEPGINTQKLGKLLRARVNKEYSQKIFAALMEFLRKDDFLCRLRGDSEIIRAFKQAKRTAGFINVPSKIDAIGQALKIAAEISDMKHPYTYGHSLRVSRYALSIALAMKLDHDRVTRVKWAALMHDIGKISVSRKILDKPGKLSDREFKKIHQHVRLTEEIMFMIPSLSEITPLAASHHEYFDGSGYPHGLKDKQIPLETKIITVCDAFDAMISNRPYREGGSLESSCREIKRLSGKQFDPEVVKFAIPIFHSLGL